MTSVYDFGRMRPEYEQLFGADLVPVEGAVKSEFADVFVSGDPARMYKMIRQTKKPCLAFKILAAGRRCEEVKHVEEAFQEAFANLKSTDAVIVGMYPRYTDQVKENAEYVRQFGSRSA